MKALPRWLRRVGIEVAGWALIVLGLAALVLPGPGLLAIVAGLALLSLRYRWANRFLRPVKAKAFEAAEKGVQTWPRIGFSASGAVSVMAAGILWGAWGKTPPWWPYGDALWLPGGWGTGTGLIISGLIALGLIVYSCRKFRGRATRNSGAVETADSRRAPGNQA
ncbi:PGPGW domain-containing protein [Arthrobacter sp. zg-Y1219]|uniref:PGPGW domain-containing protein n=1 Tax=Arthrobacter sp. zg-Y1219 TaxID=3049067 RepID=UPI0024C44272|nr:PGPGW domain-containing protein [Arthrobacter sp. zg-Y1219]MDK1360714.1 PGPGW domain-containing protein [Arthrobacter sp. zg-Y1219]